MRHLLILMLMPAALLCSSCGLNLGELRNDIGVVAKSLKEKSEALDKKIDAASAKVDAAMTAAKNAGLNVDGTEGDFIDSVKKNPGKAWSIGLVNLALALVGVWYRNRSKTATRAATAMVDAAEALPPEARELYKAQAASSTHMGAAETALIATLKAR